MQWYTAAQAADLLGLKSRETVYRMCKRGELAHRYFGNRLRIPATALNMPTEVVPLQIPRRA